MLMLAALSICVFWIAITWWFRIAFYRTAGEEAHLGDAQFYLELSKTGKTIWPFHMRWLYGKLLVKWGKNAKQINMVALCLSCLVLLKLLEYWKLTWEQQLFAIVLWIGLQGIFSRNILDPIRPDAVALFLQLTSTLLFVHEYFVISILLTLLSACIREDSPICVALWTFSPWPLLGLLAPAIRKFYWPPRKNAGMVQFDSPITLRNARLLRGQTRILNVQNILGPWGVVSLCLFNMTPTLAIVILVGYATLLVANDLMRNPLIWAWPMAVVATATFVPIEYMLPLAILHLLLEDTIGVVRV